MAALRLSDAKRTGGSSDAPVQIRLTNLNEWLRSMEKDYKDGIEAGEAALGAALRRYVYGPSQRLVPVDTGILKSSGYVIAQRDARERLLGAVGYDTDYAIYVHENPSARHKAPTQWKFVEQPFVENAERVAEAVLAAILREFD